MQVCTGCEEKIMLQCQVTIPDTVLQKCFIPQCEEKKHIQGKWQIQKKILFPGYVFIVTDEPEKLQMYLKNINGLTKLLGDDEGIVPLTDSEIEFLKTFGGEEQIVRMSEGIIENSKVIIQSGVLKGWEAYIKKIDRHKRKAYLELEMFGKLRSIEVGLEIFTKS
ncbi:MAG: antiterminator LoaP [Clostridia bacterium]|nr:antiterminator LoaP [Clostridia bacterium]